MRVRPSIARSSNRGVPSRFRLNLTTLSMSAADGCTRRKFATTLSRSAKPSRSIGIPSSCAVYLRVLHKAFDSFSILTPCCEMTPPMLWYLVARICCRRHYITYMMRTRKRHKIGTRYARTEPNQIILNTGNSDGTRGRTTPVALGHTTLLEHRPRLWIA